MMLSIPAKDIIHSPPDFRAKILFNHEKYIGEETLFSIDGFQH